MSGAQVDILDGFSMDIIKSLDSSGLKATVQQLRDFLTLVTKLKWPLNRQQVVTNSQTHITSLTSVVNSRIWNPNIQTNLNNSSEDFDRGIEHKTM